jgi:hypothetical protein
MVKTRAMTNKRRSRNNSYARRVRKSPCRGKKSITCRKTSGCKYSSGKKRSFCRKNRNTKRMRGGSGTTHHSGSNTLVHSPVSK